MALSAGSVVAEFTANTKDFVKGVQSASDSVNNLEKGIKEKAKSISQQIKKIGDKMTSVGKDLTTKVTVPLMAIGGIAVNTAKNFDDQMRKVQAISGVTGEGFDKLRDAALHFGATTAHSASNVGKALEFLALAGWDVQKSIDALPGLLNLASAAGLDLGRTSDILTDTMSAFGIEESKATNIADLFANVQSKTNTTVDMLGEAMKYASPIASAMGQNIEEVMVALGGMANAGIKGSMAGTTFTAIMQGLTKRNKEGKLVLEEMGVQIFDNEGKMRNLTDIMVDLGKKTGVMTSEQKEMFLGQVFGQQAMKGVLTLTEMEESALRDLSSAMYDSTGTAQRMADTMEGGAGGAFRKLMSAVEGAQIKLGDALLPTIQDKIIPIIEKLVNFIVKVIDKFNNLSPTIQNVILAVIGIVVALGPVLIIFGAVFGAIGKIISVFSMLFPIIKVVIGVFGGVMKILAPLIGLFKVIVGVILGFNPIVIAIVVAIGALIAIGVALYKNFNSIKNIVQGVASVIGSFIKTLAKIAMPAPLKAIIDGFKALGNVKLPGGFKIPGFANGVRNFGGGLAVVGERGPELVNLPKGSDVFTNEESRRMAGGSGITIETMNIKSGVDWEVGASYLAQKLRLS